MTPLIEQRRAAIADLCGRYGVRRLDVFGSGARGEDFDAARSDIDLMVEFEDGAGGMSDFIDFKEALEALLGRPVDLVDRGAVEASRNYIRRRRILKEAQLVHGG